MAVEKNQVAIERQKILFQRVLVAQQNLVSKAVSLRMNQRNLPPPLAYQIVAGRFRRKGVVKLNAIRCVTFQAVNQHYVGPVDLERKPRADD